MESSLGMKMERYVPRIEHVVNSIGFASFEVITNISTLTKAIAKENIWL